MSIRFEIEEMPNSSHQLGDQNAKFKIVKFIETIDGVEKKSDTRHKNLSLDEALEKLGKIENKN